MKSDLFHQKNIIIMANGEFYETKLWKLKFKRNIILLKILKSKYNFISSNLNTKFLSSI